MKRAVATKFFPPGTSKGHIYISFPKDRTSKDQRSYDTAFIQTQTIRRAQIQKFPKSWPHIWPGKMLKPSAPLVAKSILATSTLSVRGDWIFTMCQALGGPVGRDEGIALSAKNMISMPTADPSKWIPVLGKSMGLHKMKAHGHTQ